MGGLLVEVSNGCAFTSLLLLGDWRLQSNSQSNLMMRLVDGCVVCFSVVSYLKLELQWGLRWSLQADSRLRSLESMVLAGMVPVGVAMDGQWQRQRTVLFTMERSNGTVAMVFTMDQGKGKEVVQSLLQEQADIVSGDGGISLVLAPALQLGRSVVMVKLGSKQVNRRYFAVFHKVENLVVRINLIFRTLGFHLIEDKIIAYHLSFWSYQWL